MQQARQRRGGGYHRQGEMDPEDIFNMFFGIPPGGGVHGMPRRQRPQYRQQHTQGEVNMNLVQLLPFGMLLLFSLISSLNLSSDAPYSLRKDTSYPLERATELLGVRYWVPESFELRHTDAAALRRVEDAVEADNLQRLRRRCQAERISKQKMAEAAKEAPAEGRAKMQEAIDAVSMRWCDEKDRVETLRGGG